MTQSVPTLCGSIAGKASALGVRMHDAGYRALGLDYKYIAFGTDNLETTLRGIVDIGFRGVGISMPFKQSVLSMLNEYSDDVSSIGACNTVVINQGHLVGHNTDWQGALAALDENYHAPISTALIVGAGGVARAIAYGLTRRGIQVYVAARSVSQRQVLVRELGLAGDLSLEQQSTVPADLLVNATPQFELAEHPLNLDAHRHARVVFDVVFSQLETPLLKSAKARGFGAIAGWRMLLHQAGYQFQLYTGRQPPLDRMSTVLEEAFAG